MIFDIQFANIKSGHHQIGGWHADDILNKELKYFMRHIFSPHICYPLKLFLPSHKLREPIPSIHSFKTTITNKSVWRKSLKFMYSEKATIFCEIFTLLLSYVVPVKRKVKISQNFVAFSEYMNFKLFSKGLFGVFKSAKK